MAVYLPFLSRAALVVIGLIAVALVALLLLRLLGYIQSPTKTALSLFQSPKSVLKSTLGRTNVLILGKGGAGHEAPDLTDTIIFLSYNHETGTALMLSLPRDIWVDSLQAKINTAYYYGEERQPGGGGLILAKSAVSEIVGQPVHYAVALDFTGFTRLIDALGGVDIDVPRSFNDLKYPIPGKENVLPESDRYEKLHFDSGLQTMSGERALKYVRSRNSEGEEGTDYARAVRQQQALLSLQDKLLSSKVLLNPRKVSELMGLVSTSITTDIRNGEYTGFLKIALGFDRAKLRSETIDQGDKAANRPGLLTNPPPADFQGQWVLVGENNSWDKVQEHVTSLLDAQ